MSEELATSEAAGIAACGNCGLRLQGAWCHGCGQRAVTARLGFRSMAGDFVERAVQLESGMLRSLVGLVRDPRESIHAWLDGRRRQQAHPFALLLVVATLSLLSTNLMGEGFWDEFDLVIKAQATALHGHPQRLQRFVDFYRFLYAALPYWMLLFTLPTALLMRALFPRTPLRVAEYWVATIYAASLAILLDLPLSLGLNALGVAVAQQILATNLLLMLVQAWVLARFQAAGFAGALRVVLAVILAYAIGGSLQNLGAYSYAWL